MIGNLCTFFLLPGPPSAHTPFTMALIPKLTLTPSLFQVLRVPCTYCKGLYMRSSLREGLC